MKSELSAIRSDERHRNSSTRSDSSAARVEYIGLFLGYMKSRNLPSGAVMFALLGSSEGFDQTRVKTTASVLVWLR
jgi:hypothetical protein